MQSQENTQIPVSTESPSKWWAWSLAILILIWSLFGAFSAALNYYLVNSGFYDGIFSDAKDGMGPYPENGTSREKQEWNESYEFLDSIDEEFADLQQTNLQLQFGLISLLFGFVACFLLFSRDPNGFKAAGVWLGVIAITGTITQIISLTSMNDFYDNIPSIDSSLITGISTGISIGTSLTCYLTLFGFIYIAAIKSKTEDDLTESGFHQ
ncbi:MAG: Uncharacterised protein [Methanobacteriota archaeon]|nr:MAG: Uncharacterised protein [Euryarchaeota archaeon]